MKCSSVPLMVTGLFLAGCTMQRNTGSTSDLAMAGMPCHQTPHRTMMGDCYKKQDSTMGGGMMTSFSVEQ